MTSDSKAIAITHEITVDWSDLGDEFYYEGSYARAEFLKAVADIHHANRFISTTAVANTVEAIEHNYGNDGIERIKTYLADLLEGLNNNDN